MNIRNCVNCRLDKPLNLFAIRRGGLWIYADRCKPCRKIAKPFQRFWKPLKPEIREKNLMTKRARDAGASVIIPFTKREIIRRDYPSGNIFCYLCGDELTEKTATIDHVQPLSLGGYHCPNNAKIACKSCNSAKGNKTLVEYLNR